MNGACDVCIFFGRYREMRDLVRHPECLRWILAHIRKPRINPTKKRP